MLIFGLAEKASIFQEDKLVSEILVLPITGHVALGKSLQLPNHGFLLVVKRGQDLFYSIKIKGRTHS